MSVLTHPWISSPSDGLSSSTLQTQLEVENSISTLLTAHIASFASPLLQKSSHLNFLTRLLIKELPAGFTGLDASRPWLLYWCLHSLALLEGELDLGSRMRVANTLEFCQGGGVEGIGGFGGGPGQLGHLAPSFAAVESLSYAGEEGWEMIDREGMYRFLMSMKKEDGSFIMHKGGEVDVRGCYCALTIATLLNLLTPELVLNVKEFIISCQTYEGGLASAATDDKNTSPLGEAHGGYTFCAIASYAIIDPLTKSIGGAGKKELNWNNLLRWASGLQAMPIEGGGFRGRTNKLVDGCYGWWGGGLFGLLDGLMSAENNGLENVDVYDRGALQEYILLLAQAPGGGLRDKPGKPADAYHTCYNLSGLSSAQSKYLQSPAKIADLADSFVSPFEKSGLVEIGDDEKVLRKEVVMILGEGESEAEAELRMRTLYSQTLGWELSGEKLLIGGEENELMPTHPIFNLTLPHLQRMMAYFYKQPIPKSN